MINNAFNQLIFLASTSKLGRTLKPDSDGAVKAKLFKVTKKNFFAVRCGMVQESFSKSLLELKCLISQIASVS
jgi:hypothetical protein